jgi:hypothetical protein
MSNPQINQGTLNRLLASVVFASFQQLNVTSPFMGKEAVSLAFDGETSGLHPTLTGAVPSPEPYVFANVTIHILKTQILGAVFKAQYESNTTMGSVTVIPDTVTLPPYQLEDCVLSGVQDLDLSGNNPGMVIKLRGIYRINSTAFFGS